MSTPGSAGAGDLHPLAQISASFLGIPVRWSMRVGTTRGPGVVCLVSGQDGPASVILAVNDADGDSTVTPMTRAQVAALRDALTGWLEEL